jgi:hypothetical protein
MNAEETCLMVRLDGTCQGLYTEAVDLTTLGRLQVQRVMVINFDYHHQAWRVVDRERHCLYCSPSREACLAWERQYLNWALANQ